MKRFQAILCFVSWDKHEKKFVDYRLGSEFDRILDADTWKINRIPFNVKLGYYPIRYSVWDWNKAKRVIVEDFPEYKLEDLRNEK